VHLRYWPSGGRDLFPSSAPGFEPHCARLSPPRCLTCLLSLQDVQWAVRLVVVRASWPDIYVNKKKKRNAIQVHSLSHERLYLLACQFIIGKDK